MGRNSAAFGPGIRLWCSDLFDVFAERRHRPSKAVFERGLEWIVFARKSLANFPLFSPTCIIKFCSYTTSSSGGVSHGLDSLYRRYGGGIASPVLSARRVLSGCNLPKASHRKGSGSPGTTAAVTLDIHMSEHSGYQVLSELQNFPKGLRFLCFQRITILSSWSGRCEPGRRIFIQALYHPHAPAENPKSNL